MYIGSVVTLYSQNTTIMKKTFSLIMLACALSAPAMASTSNSNGPTNNYYDQSTTNAPTAIASSDASALGIGIGGDATAFGGTGIGFGGSATIQKGAVENNVIDIIAVDQKLNSAITSVNGQSQSQNMNGANNAKQEVNIKNKQNPVFHDAITLDIRYPEGKMSDETEKVNIAAVDKERDTVNLLHQGKMHIKRYETYGVRVVITYYDQLKKFEGSQDNTVDFATSDASSIPVIASVKAFPSGSSADVTPEMIDAVTHETVARFWHGLKVIRFNDLCRDSVEDFAKGRSASVSNGAAAVNYAGDIAGSVIAGIGGTSGRVYKDVRSVHVYGVVAK